MTSLLVDGWEPGIEAVSRLLHGYNNPCSNIVITTLLFTKTCCNLASTHEQLHESLYIGASVDMYAYT